MKRSLLGLAGILAALLVIAYVVTLRPGETSVKVGAGENLVTVDSAKADRIEISTPESHVTLEKRGVQWFVVSPVEDRADDKNIGTALQRASDLRVKSIVSERPEKHGIFQVDSGGTRVTIRQADGEPVSFIVGKNSPSSAETYMRKESSDEVALVDGAFSWVFNKQVKEWRDRTLLSVPKESIREVGFRYGDTTFTLAFDDSLWTIGGQQANPTSVNTLLSALSALQCDDFLDTPSRSRTVARITVEGVQFSFSYEAGSKKYSVLRSTDGRWFVVDGWRADQVLKRKKDLT